MLLFIRAKLVEKMKCGPYSLATDGSNNNGIDKMFPLTVSAPTEEGISTQFLDMCLGTSATAEGKNH